MTTISLKIPAALERRLAHVAERKGTSRSAVIRDALEGFIERNTSRSGSCLAKAAELIGCVEGPADLSHNKKRLERFGR
jgi:predicted transcriptional regulator